MKRRFLVVALSVTAVLACALGLTACGEQNTGNNGQGGNNEPTVHTHTLSFVPAKAADCVNTGNTEYYTCTCGKWFSDSGATVEITDKSSIVIGVTEHKYSSEWSKDGTQHWHECTVCKDKKDIENHTEGAEATETTAQICTVCEYELVAPLGHTHKTTLVPAKAADCEVKGNIEYYTCACGKWFLDDKAVNEITDKSSVEINATGHSYSSEWSYSSTEHWHAATCKHTNEKDGLHGHNFADEVCTVCKYSVGLLSFSTLQLGENDTVYGKVSNDTTTFSFLKEITANNGSTYIVCTDLACTQTVPSKTVSLNVGDNTFYILSERGNDLTLFTVTIRRRPIYTLTFQTSGTGVSSQQVEEDSFAVQPEETTKTGYTFTNWTVNNNAVNFPYTITDSITFTAAFTANDYTATLDVNGGDILGQLQITVTYDKDFSLATPTRTGYTFLGWYVDETKVTSTTWKYAEDKTFTAKWKANAYKLTVSYDSYSHGSVSGGGTYDCDSSVTVTATTKAGYTFIGWYDSKETMLSLDLRYTFTMSAENTTYTAKWCKVSTQSNGTNMGTVITLDGTYIAGEEIALTATVKDGYTFMGWYNGETLLSNDLTYNVKMPSENTVFTAKWNYYTVTTTKNYSSAGSITSYSDKKISVGNSVTLTAETYLGYNWLGWYQDDELITSELSYTFFMQKENATFTATWEIWDGLEIFDFSSSKTSLSIFGLIDETLTEIDIPHGVTSIEDETFKDCSRLTSVTIPDSVTSIGNGAFSGCSGLTSLTIPDSVKYIGYNYGAGYKAGYTFYNCSGLTSITISDSVTRIYDYTFYGCSSLTCITIPDSVTSIGVYAFSGCSGLTNAIIGNGVTLIGEYAFRDCSELTSVTIGNGVTLIWEYAFRDCSGLTSITIPDSVTSIGDSAFRGCSGLTSITLPDSVTSIGNGAFSGCSGLTSITIPDSVTSIGGYAFCNCSGLTSITIPDGVTSIGYSAFKDTAYYNNEVHWVGNALYIGNYLVGVKSDLSFSITVKEGTKCITDGAFLWSDSFSQITIPESVTYIGAQAFWKCSHLTKIYFNGTMTQWKAIKKGTDWNTGTGSYTIYCNDGNIK